VRGPRGVAQGGIDAGGIRSFIRLPLRDVAGEGELAERLAESGDQRRFQRDRVDGRRGVRLVCVHRLALNEQALAGEQRRQLVVACRQLADLFADAEQLGGEVLEVGRDRDQQFRFGLWRERVGGRARRLHACAQVGVSDTEVGKESGVQAQQAGAGVELAELQVESQRKAGGIEVGVDSGIHSGKAGGREREKTRIIARGFAGLMRAGTKEITDSGP
jgi:hypothetical protein